MHPISAFNKLQAYQCLGDIPAENWLKNTSVGAFLSRWASRDNMVARLGFRAEKSYEKVDHTFVIARHDDHYALYQSDVGRYFVFQGQPVDTWSLTPDEFEILIKTLVASRDYRGFFHQLNRIDTLNTIGHFRALTSYYSLSFAMENIRRTW